MEQQIKDINNEFIKRTNDFVLENSVKQTEIILNNTIEIVQEGIDKGLNKYNKDINNIEEDITDLESEINSVNFSVLLTGSDKKELLKLKVDLKNKIIKRDLTIKNKEKVIEKEFKDDFINKSRNRSETISELETGSSASESMEAEASSVNNKVLGTTLIEMVKNWVDIGDSKVRNSHVIADNRYQYNPIPVNSFFQVGNSLLRYARDLGGDISQIIRCRCQNVYTIIRKKINNS